MPVHSHLINSKSSVQEVLFRTISSSDYREVEIITHQINGYQYFFQTYVLNVLKECLKETFLLCINPETFLFRAKNLCPLQYFFQDIVEEGTKPRFITDGLSRFDLDQGKLGKCLLLNNQLYAKIGYLINDYDCDAIQ